MIYGYCRAATVTQANRGRLFEAQEDEILRAYPTAQLYKEIFQAATLDRPLLKELLSKLNEGDTLCVTKLDRLARDTQESVDIVKELLSRGIVLHALNLGILENTEKGQFFLSILSALVEMEKALISEKTLIGRELVRKRGGGYKDGRRRTYTIDQLDHAMKLLEENSYTKVAEMTNMSKATLTRERRKRKARALANS